MRSGRGQCAPVYNQSSGTDVDVAKLPQCFNSDLSDGDEFWGFPEGSAELDLPSQHSISYSLDARGTALFQDSDENENFKGFTRYQVYDINKNSSKFSR